MHSQTGSKSPRAADGVASSAGITATVRKSDHVFRKLNTLALFSVPLLLVTQHALSAPLNNAEAVYRANLDMKDAQHRCITKVDPCAICANFETGPKRSGSGGERTVEQRAGRGTT